MQVCVIVPSLNPDEKMVNTVNGLIEYGFNDIIDVNDGSDEAHMAPFETVAKLDCYQMYKGALALYRAVFQ